MNTVQLFVLRVGSVYHVSTTRTRARLGEVNSTTSDLHT
jgi:hypothetical protein